jgi:hypothetical protein
VRSLAIGSGSGFFAGALGALRAGVATAAGSVALFAAGAGATLLARDSSMLMLSLRARGAPSRTAAGRGALGGGRTGSTPATGIGVTVTLAVAGGWTAARDVAVALAAVAAGDASSAALATLGAAGRGNAALATLGAAGRGNAALWLAALTSGAAGRAGMRDKSHTPARPPTNASASANARCWDQVLSAAEPGGGSLEGGRMLALCGRRLETAPVSAR